MNGTDGFPEAELCSRLLTAKEVGELLQLYAALEAAP